MLTKLMSQTFDKMLFLGNDGCRGGATYCPQIIFDSFKGELTISNEIPDLKFI